MQTNIKSPDSHHAAASLAELIRVPLVGGQHVLWLVSGGSSLPIAVEAAQLLQACDQTNLWVTLVDDIFVPQGSPESNGQRLRDLGFSLNGGNFEEILRNKSLTDTAREFNALLQDHVAFADVAIGQFGIGAGYHTGGIHPHSTAAREQSALAIGYQDGETGRITVTPALIAKLQTAFINSYGESKKPLVEHFLESDATIVDEPTQCLKRAAHLFVYSDTIV
jgi:6-phosphogluconolactonase/glucosamine-6-phosphate isomerase/deaminase